MKLTFKNKWVAVLSAALVVILVTSAVFADEPVTGPTVATVTDAAGLTAALSDSVVTTINITDDISLPAKLVVSHGVTINGNGKTLTLVDNPTGWQGNYVLQVYNTTDSVSINNLSLTHGDAALLVNGSTNVSVSGVNVSGNEFGGIEVSKGSGVAENGALTVTSVTNADEKYGAPTIWTLDGEGSVTGGSFTTSTAVVSGQTQYYLIAANTNSVIVDSEAELTAALARADITTINLGSNISTTKQITISKPLVFNGAGFTISPSFTKVDGANNASIGVINTQDVTINNVTIDGTDGHNLHGINLFGSTNVSITGVSIMNNQHTGLSVNGTTVTISGITTSNNGWGGIDVDQPADATTPAALTIAGTVTQTEAVDMIKDDNSKQATVTDSLGQYASAEYTHDTSIIGTMYSLKSATVGTEAALRTALAKPLVSTITLNNDITLTAMLDINRAVTIDGATHKIIAGFSNDSVIQISANDVTVKNLIEDATGTTGNRGINVYRAAGVLLDTVTVSNNSKNGIVVNGSTVTVNNISTLNNGWEGIDVDLGSGVTTPASLTVNGVSTDNNNTRAAIRIDDITKAVSVTDTNNQYVATTAGNTTDYMLIAKTTVNSSDSKAEVTSSTVPVSVIVDDSSAAPKIDVHTLVTAGVATLPQINVISDNAVVNIPSGTTVTATGTWDGIINAPTVTTAFTLPAPTGIATTAVLGLEVGAGDTPLVFSNPVKLTFAGQAGNLIGWSQAGTFHAITAECDSATAPALADGADCRTTVGSDLVVWTKHFTTFVTYTQTAISSGGGGGFSGGGGAPVATTSAPVAVQPVQTAPVGQVLGAESFNFTLALKIGARGDEVIQLQARLTTDGFTLVQDGKFGPKTKAALMKWQKAHKLSADGIVGPKTRAALNAQ